MTTPQELNLCLYLLVMAAMCGPALLWEVYRIGHRHGLQAGKYVGYAVGFQDGHAAAREEVLQAKKFAYVFPPES